MIRQNQFLAIAGTKLLNLTFLKEKEVSLNFSIFWGPGQIQVNRKNTGFRNKNYYLKLLCISYTFMLLGRAE